MLILHVDRGVIYQTNSILELYTPVVSDSVYVQLCGRDLRFYGRVRNVRVQLGLVHGTLHRNDAPRCTGNVKRMGAGAQR